jgi:hypothetical protein
MATILPFSTPLKQIKYVSEFAQEIVGITFIPLLCQKAPINLFLYTLNIIIICGISTYVLKSGERAALKPLNLSIFLE